MKNISSLNQSVAIMPDDSQEERSTLARLYEEAIEDKVIERNISFNDFPNWLDDFIDPVFSTNDFECSHTRNHEPHEFKTMNYLSGNKTPNLVIGHVTPFETEQKVKVYWDQHGRCRDFNARRRPDWDMIRVEELEIKAGKITLTAYVLIIIAICISI